VLANRLTADGRTKVLLLEAGPRDTDPWIHIPLGYGKLFKKPAVNWSYWSEPEPQLNGRRIFTPRGKCWAAPPRSTGSSTRAASPRISTTGKPGLSSASCCLFQKSETSRQGTGADALHGCGGPLAVSDQSETPSCATPSSRPR